MKITILGSGTSQGVPVIACHCDVCSSDDTHDKRLRSSVLIQTENTSVVVDAGPDFRQQMLRARVNTLDAILITHTHKDHIAGLDDVRSYNYLSGKAMKVYASLSDQDEIKEEFRYAFAENPYPGVPEIELMELTTNDFHIGKLHIQPLLLMHMRLQIFGFRIGGFAYLTDVNFIPEDSMKKLHGVHTLVIDALRKKPHPSHFNLEEAISVAQHLQPERTFFTHISHLMGRHMDVQNELPEKMWLAYDGLEIEMP